MSNSYRLRGLPEIDRFWEQVMPEPNSGCWLWIGATSDRGYGQFGKAGGGGLHIAHRFSYELYRGKIPDGLELDHLCRIHCCVNPEHLEAVTHLVNVRRGRSVEPHPTTATVCSRGHDLTDPSNFRRLKDGHRRCHACHVLRAKAHRHKKKREAEECLSL